MISAAPDGAPQDVQLEAISSQGIKVTWKVKFWVNAYSVLYHISIYIANLLEVLH